MDSDSDLLIVAEATSCITFRVLVVHSWLALTAQRSQVLLRVRKQTQKVP